MYNVQVFPLQRGREEGSEGGRSGSGEGGRRGSGEGGRRGSGDGGKRGSCEESEEDELNMTHARSLEVLVPAGKSCVK